ncbi:FkbM family methyltransferase [Occallatibacter riparius]|uniref:FkbM family methyltransferase n=1 Tax=Occallatibacter riparius TaxID=1002689 RepID=A0A9J7BMI5_9BACT|nr:FkbM family methyltransferase [Occallatibacter riparius]UWZ84092.1 FkbM family methyltransferase [Occallatibacter riparius]
MQRKIIYDFGANNGDDIPYYLKKADVVVAVEANPSLCREIETRFSEEIRDGRLQVENCVVAAEGSSPEVYFYLHKRHHVLGQFPEPDATVIGDFEKVLLPAKSVMQIVGEHGAPYYIKIDIEHYEEVILKELFRNAVKPAFISAEAHSIQVFALMAGMGEYSAFKLVDGETVAKKYRSHAIRVGGGVEPYSFPAHSAGPFGEDIAGEWMNADDLFHVLAKEGLGWKDIHATNRVQLDPGSQVEKRRQKMRHLRGWVGTKLRGR